MSKLFRIYSIVFCFGFLQLFALNKAGAQTKATLSGRVINSSGAGIPGATVILNIKDRNYGNAITDGDGVFILSNIETEKKYSIRVSAIGFQTYARDDLQWNGQNDPIVITLVDSVRVLEEAIVIGYGKQDRSKITSAITTIKPDNIDKGAVFDPAKLLQGRAAGVSVQSSSGIPGSRIMIRVRGVGSISGSSSPLIVVDGVPGEYMPNISPGDIASMEVLKDAAATAIYGSRANNGVIIITTKTGTAGKTKINLSAYTGIGEVANDIKMANSAQYIEVMQAAIDNYNQQKGTNLSFYIPEKIDDTDWMAAISRERPAIKSVNFNAAGGSDRTTFFTSFSAFDQQGSLVRSFFRQYNARLNLNHRVNKKLSFYFNLSGNYDKRRLLDEESTSLKPIRYARENQPWYGVFDSAGGYTLISNPLTRYNPLMLINERNWIQENYRGIGAAGLEYSPIAGLTFTSAIKTDVNLFEDNMTMTPEMTARAISAGWGAVAKTRGLRARYVWDNFVSYKNNWNLFNYSIQAGHTFERLSDDVLGAFSDNYNNGAFPSENFNLVNSGINIYARDIGYTGYAVESYIGRLSLDYGNRYILNLSVRTDGSSRFSESKRFGTFPAVSLGWNVDRENFWKPGIISRLKLRTSYGVTGSMDGIGNFAPLSLVGAGVSYNGQGGLQISQDAQQVTWEKAHQFNIGAEAELLDGNLTVTADYFDQRTTNLLYNMPIYATSGFSSVASNIGVLQNRGFELSAKYLAVQTKELTWDVGFNLSFINNKLRSLYEGVDQYVVPASGNSSLGGVIHALIKGKPIGAYYMLRQVGIYQYDSEVPQTLFDKGVRAGDVHYEDVNKDGDINDDDRQYVGSAMPNFFGGITSDLQWKGIELNIFSQFSKGGKVFASWRGPNGATGTEQMGNALSTAIKTPDGRTTEQYYNVSAASYYDYWRGPGTSNTMPRPIRQGAFSGYQFGYNVLTSTRFLEDGSYFRIRTVTLAYNLPERMLKKTGFAGLRFYFTADNFLTFTKYSGYDPEQSFVFSPGDANYGVDYGHQPVLRNYIVGINLKF